MTLSRVEDPPDWLNEYVTDDLIRDVTLLPDPGPGVAFRPHGQDLIWKLQENGVNAHFYGEPQTPTILLEESEEALGAAIAISIVSDFVASAGWDLFKLAIAAWLDRMALEATPKPRRVRILNVIPRPGSLP